jgi:hypothetical protein
MKKLKKIGFAGLCLSRNGIVIWFFPSLKHMTEGNLGSAFLSANREDYQ